MMAVPTIAMSHFIELSQAEIEQDPLIGRSDGGCIQPGDTLAWITSTILLVACVMGVPANLYTLVRLCNTRHLLVELPLGFNLAVQGLLMCLVVVPLRAVDLILRSSEGYVPHSSSVEAFTSVLGHLFHSVGLCSAAEQAMLHVWCCTPWRMKRCLVFINLVPWLFGAAYTGLHVAVTYTTPPFGFLMDWHLYCPQRYQGSNLTAVALHGFTDVAMVTVSFLLQVVCSSVALRDLRKRQTTVGVRYSHQHRQVDSYDMRPSQSTLNDMEQVRRKASQISGASMNVKVSVSGASAAFSCVAPPNNVQRISICDSNLANCSSSTDSVAAGVGYHDYKARLHARLGSDVGDDAEEMCRGLLLPGMVEGQDKQGNILPEVGNIKDGGQPMASVEVLPAVSAENLPWTHIYTISEDMLQESLQEATHSRPSARSNPSHGSEDCPTSDSLNVPQSGVSSSSRSFSTKSSSMESTSGHHLSVSASGSWSSQSRNFFRLPRPYSRSHGSSRSMSSGSETTLPPLRHSRRIPGSSHLSSPSQGDVPCMMDAATTTQDLELSTQYQGTQILNPKVLLSGMSQKGAGHLQEAWGKEAGNTVMHHLGTNHPFFKEHKLSLTADEKISCWKMSSSTGLTGTDCEQPIDESAFYDLCVNQTSDRRSTVTSQVQSSCDNLRSISQQEDSNVSRSLKQQEKKMPIEINVIRPSESTTGPTIYGGRMLKRKMGMISSPVDATGGVNHSDPVPSLPELQADSDQGSCNDASNGRHPSQVSSMHEVGCQAEVTPRHLVIQDTSERLNIHISVEESARTMQGMLRMGACLTVCFGLLLASAVLTVTVATKGSEAERSLLDALLVIRSLSSCWYAMLGVLYVLINVAFQVKIPSPGQPYLN